MTSRTLIAFGCGYVAVALAQRLAAQGWATIGTTRSETGAAQLAAAGVTPVLWPSPPEGSAERPGADLSIAWPGGQAGPAQGAAWLISVPPDQEGCPVFRALGSAAKAAGWIGYLSTTGVYGDLEGGWAFEDAPLAPQSPEASNRAVAEAQWLSLSAEIFRLPGIYGPGRSALERAAAPGARRILKPGQIFSRAHRDDIASALEAALGRPAPGAVYNICDDEPAPADEVLAYAAALLGRPPPPAVGWEEAGLSPMAQRFYAECKRVSNAKAKAALGWSPRFVSYREGLAACLAASTSSATLRQEATISAMSDGRDNR